MLKLRHINYSIIWVFCCLTCQSAFAQLNVSLLGDAIAEGDNCFIITQDVLNQAGGVWFDNPIDFDEDFSINYQNEFGSKDANGADGMALVFKSNATPELGTVGGGLGYAGISPSLVVEFDTFENTVNADPFFDHIGVLLNGNPNHLGPNPSLSFPVQASPTSQNIEDGQSHEIKINWLASQQLFEVYFDCELRLSRNIDIKNDVFNGDDTVFFGFVGSTGGLSNIHRVCFNAISFVDNLQLEDESICLGDSTTIDASVPSGETYSWTPTTGVNNPSSPVVVLSPTQNTTYTVTITDACGESISEDVEITVLDIVETTFDTIPPVCSGDNTNPLPSTSSNGISGTWSPAFDNSTTTTYTFTPNPGECGTATSLEIEVLTSILPEFEPVDAICIGENLDPLPIVSLNGFSGTWSPDLNNTETTTYTFTPDPDQGCSTTTTLTINVDEGTIPQFNPIESVCEGRETFVLPNVSLEGIMGVWNPEINNMVTTTYTFTPEVDQCALPTEFTVTVNPFTDISLEATIVSETFSDLVSVTLDVIGGNGSYEFRLNEGPWQNSNQFENLDVNELLQFQARQINGCSTTAVKVVNTIKFQDYFTPNNDGINDYWNIEGLRDQPNAKIYIFDRYGKLLEQISPLQVGWDGTFNGRLMPSNDYWFRVEFTNHRTQAPAVFSNHFTLKR